MSLTPEDALLAVRAAGLDATAIEEQIQTGRDDDAGGLEARLADLESKLADQASKADHEERARSFAHSYLDALNRSRTSRWAHEEQPDAA